MYEYSSVFAQIIITGHALTHSIKRVCDVMHGSVCVKECVHVSVYFAC